MRWRPERGLWPLLCVLGLLGVCTAHAAGRVYVSSEQDNTVTVLDAARGDQVAAPVVCKRPRHMQWTRDRKQLLVACGDDHVIAVWDPATSKVLARLDVGEDPEAFDISPDGRTLYVSNEEDSALTA